MTFWSGLSLITRATKLHNRSWLYFKPLQKPSVFLASLYPVKLGNIYLLRSWTLCCGVCGMEFQPRGWVCTVLYISGIPMYLTYNVFCLLSKDKSCVESLISTFYQEPKKCMYLVLSSIRIAHVNHVLIFYEKLKLEHNYYYFQSRELWLWGQLQFPSHKN